MFRRNLFIDIYFKILIIVPLFTTIGANNVLQPKIIHGDAAKPGQFPYQVVLFKDGKQVCGGAVINADFVLTAAHCVFKYGRVVEPSRLLIKAGYIDLDSPLIQNFSVVEIHYPRKFNRITLTSDIALLKVGIPFQIKKDVIEPVVLASTTVPDDTLCVVSGWGTQKQNTTDMPTKLYYAELQIINHQSCKTAYRGKNDVDSRMICASGNQGLKDACEGDSGGPLVCNGKLTGLVSWAVGCGLRNYPGVYTQVLSYRKWIDSFIHGR